MSRAERSLRLDARAMVNATHESAKMCICVCVCVCVWRCLVPKVRHLPFHRAVHTRWLYELCTAHNVQLIVQSDSTTVTPKQTETHTHTQTLQASPCYRVDEA